MKEPIKTRRLAFFSGEYRWLKKWAKRGRRAGAKKWVRRQSHRLARREQRRLIEWEMAA